MRAQDAHAHRKETMMRFYQHHQQHLFYCGVDLHARSMYLCVLDQAGQTLLHQDFAADGHTFLEATALRRAALTNPCRSRGPGNGTLADPAEVFGAARVCLL